MVLVSYLVGRSAEDPEGLQGCGILTVHLPALQLQVGNIHACTVLRIRITFMWIRIGILPFALMRIVIRILLMRIRIL